MNNDKLLKFWVNSEIEYNKLPSSEQQDLWHGVYRGDKIAREIVIKGNLPLVASIVKRSSYQFQSREDLFQAGIIGLIKAVDGYKLARGFQFSTYAVPFIIGEIKRQLEESEPKKISRDVRSLIKKISDARQKLTHINSKEPTINELSIFLEVPVEHIVYAMEISAENVSLDDKVVDLVKDNENQYAKVDNLLMLKDLLHQLPSKERFVLVNRYLDNRSQQEIADILLISQAQVSRLEKSGLYKLNKITRG